MTSPSTSKRLTRAISEWFLENHRAFPWRPEPPTTQRDPWHALVSEIMLQQTQAARVAERFPRVIARFSTPTALAEAPVDDLLALWSGLGYYRRARLLHACARAIVDRHSGHVPADPADLLALPGIGRYTAGAIASIALAQPEPIVDGNVSRVLMRLSARRGTPRDKDNERWSWEQATQLVQSAHEPGIFNEALMEFGATVCTPRSPRCTSCPLATACDAFQQGRQEDIPEPSPKAKRSSIRCVSLVTRDARDRLLVEQRSQTGLWAGLWQVPTLESTDDPPDPSPLAASLGLSTLNDLGTFLHKTTHRDIHFRAISSPDHPSLPKDAPYRWAAATELDTLGISSAQRRVIALASGPDTDTP